MTSFHSVAFLAFSLIISSSLWGMEVKKEENKKKESSSPTTPVELTHHNRAAQHNANNRPSNPNDGSPTVLLTSTSEDRNTPSNQNMSNRIPDEKLGTSYSSTGDPRANAPRAEGELRPYTVSPSHQRPSENTPRFSQPHSNFSSLREQELPRIEGVNPELVSAWINAQSHEERMSIFSTMVNNISSLNGSQMSGQDQEALLKRLKQIKQEHDVENVTSDGKLKAAGDGEGRIQKEDLRESSDYDDEGDGTWRDAGISDEQASAAGSTEYLIDEAIQKATRAASLAQRLRDQGDINHCNNRARQHNALDDISLLYKAKDHIQQARDEANRSSVGKETLPSGYSDNDLVNSYLQLALLELRSYEAKYGEYNGQHIVEEGCKFAIDILEYKINQLKQTGYRQNAHYQYALAILTNEQVNLLLENFLTALGYDKQSSYLKYQQFSQNQKEYDKQKLTTLLKICSLHQKIASLIQQRAAGSINQDLFFAQQVLGETISLPLGPLKDCSLLKLEILFALMDKPPDIHPSVDLFQSELLRSILRDVENKEEALKSSTRYYTWSEASLDNERRTLQACYRIARCYRYSDHNPNPNSIIVQPSDEQMQTFDQLIKALIETYELLSENQDNAEEIENYKKKLDELVPLFLRALKRNKCNSVPVCYTTPYLEKVCEYISASVAEFDAFYRQLKTVLK